MTKLFIGISKQIIPGAIAVYCIIFSSYGQDISSANILKPGAKPVVFLQEGVSVPNDESAPSFTPDGNGVYLSMNNAICFSKKINGNWVKPTTIAISGKWKDWDATLSPDGRRIVFVSNRPLDGAPQDKPAAKAQLWYADLVPGNNWTKPRRIDDPVNQEEFNAYAPSISKTGSICFCSRGREGNKTMCAYYAKWLGNHFDKPKRLLLNGEKDTFDPYISPDESYIIFASEGSLFISYHKDDTWLAGKKLGGRVNAAGSINGGPYVSLDGKTLYYSSNLTQGILMIPVNIPHK